MSRGDERHAVLIAGPAATAAMGLRVLGEMEEGEADHETLWRAKSAKTELTRADWVAFSAIGRT